jgi:mono/diheme cytochrome c family protein
VIAEAKAHWADHCAQCHANNGSGDTELGRNLYPRPPDMRRQETQQLTDGELYSTIKNGVRLSGMPAFGIPGDDDLDSWKLVDFVRYLPRMSEEESIQMEKLNPKTADELKEERMEDQFLNGTAQSEKHETGRKQ